MGNPGRVLAVFAHPDDETYGPGATLARLSAEGAEVRLIILTRGENASKGDSPLYSPELLAEVREKELDGACRALSIAHYEQFAFPDRGLAGVPEDELAAPIFKAIDEFQPHLVITFHPAGISGHQDHRTVSKIVKKILESMAGAGARARFPRLAYYVVPRSVAAKIEWRRLNAVPDEEVTHAVRTGGYIDAKTRAAECHKTQRYIYKRLSEFPGGIEQIWRYEFFVLHGEKPKGAPGPRLPLTP